MARKYLPSGRELAAMSGQERDESLCASYGITPRALELVRTGSLDEDLERAALLLAARGGRVTEPALAALVSEEWRFSAAVDRVHSYCGRLYGAASAQRKAAYGFGILPPIQLLREELGLYAGNLYEARDRWPSFQPSRDDWERSVTLPLAASGEAAFLLGVLWGDGHIPKGDSYSVRFSGLQSDFPFYEEVVAPAVECLFRLPAALIREQRKSRYGEAHTVEGPAIWLDSKAVATWLLRDLGFVRGRKRRLSSPSVLAEEERGTFFEGVIASIGGVFSYDGHPVLHFSDTSKPWLEELRSLGASLGYPLSEPKRAPERGYIMRFTRDGTRRAIASCRLANPRHRRRLEELSEATA